MHAKSLAISHTREAIYVCMYVWYRHVPQLCSLVFLTRKEQRFTANLENELGLKTFSSNKTLTDSVSEYSEYFMLLRLTSSL